MIKKPLHKEIYGAVYYAKENRLLKVKLLPIGFSCF